MKKESTNKTANTAVKKAAPVKKETRVPKAAPVKKVKPVKERDDAMIAARKKRKKEELVKKLKGLIVPVIFLIIVGVTAAVLISLTKKETEEDEIVVHIYEGSEDKITIKNEQLEMVLDPVTTQFTLTDKATGQVWYSNPPAADSDPVALNRIKDRLKSTLLLTHTSMTGVDVTWNNYQYCIVNKVYDIEYGSDYIKMMYSVGEVKPEYIIPQVISEERYQELLAGIDTEKYPKAKNYFREFYLQYDINKPKKDHDVKALKEKYPDYETTVLRMPTDITNLSIKEVLEAALGDAGYTKEEYEEEIERNGIESNNDKKVFNINVIYRLEGRDLVVEVPLSEIENQQDYPVYAIELIPYFGAGGPGEEGYMLIPEGGGSIIKFNNGKTSLNAYYADVYGRDLAQGRPYLIHETRTAYGVFGIAREKASFICMIEGGSAYASVKADIASLGVGADGKPIDNKESSYNYVDATFNVIHREKADVGSRVNGNVYLYEDGLPDETIRQRYRFISSGDYVDMANVYHEYLAAEFGAGFYENNEESLPVVVEIIGAVDKTKQILGVPVSRPLAVTTYKEAKNIIQTLSESGINNMSVRLSGWMNGGVRQKVLNKVHLVWGLGGKKDFKSLLNYAADNNIDLYLDGVTNYAYNSDLFDGFISFRDAATLANKKRVKLRPYDTVDFGEAEDRDYYYLLKPAVIDKMANNLADYANKYDAAGVSFVDIGYQLSADYNKKHHVSRQEALEMQVDTLQGIADSGLKVMINSGNDYMLGIADQIVNMDLAGSGYSLIDATVPFYPIALHGYVNYAGEPINLAENYEDELLKTVEYGAGLYVTFMDAPIMKLQNTYYSQYFGANFDAWKDRFLEIYRRYNSELGHTFKQNITNHDIVDSGVACTQYEDGTKVYVNYRYDAYTTADGLELPARDYLVVK